MKKHSFYNFLFGVCAAMLLTQAACGRSKFSGASEQRRTADGNTAHETNTNSGVKDDSDAFADTNSLPAEPLSLHESYTQLRPSNKTEAQAYGVFKVDLVAKGLLKDHKIVSLERSGMSDDIKFTGCNLDSAAVTSNPADGRKTFTQTVTCFMIFKGLKNPVPLHRLYPGILRVAKVGTTTAHEEKRSNTTLCVVPENEASDPCTEKSGRIVLKDIVAGKSATTLGYEVLPFPSDALVASDLAGLAK